MQHTLPETNMAWPPPKIGGWETTFLFKLPMFRCKLLVFREGIFPSQKKTDLIRCLLLVANLRNPKAASSEGWDQKSGVPQKHEGFSLISLGVSVGTCFHEHYELLKNRELPCRSADYLLLIIYYMRTLINLMKKLTNLNCFPPFPGLKKNMVKASTQQTSPQTPVASQPNNESLNDRYLRCEVTH